MDQSEHERAVIDSFVVPRKKERYRTLLLDPRRRRTALDALYHFHDLDDRYVVPVPAHLHSPADILAMLQGLGAGQTCRVISTDGSLDGRELPLHDVLESIVGRGEGSLVSCVPGRLGYFEGEGSSDRCVLHRPNA